MCSPCLKVVIIIVLVIGAIAGIIVGIILGTRPTESDDEYQIINPPSDIKIELRENYVDIQWSPSKSDYVINYKVTVQIEDDPIQKETNKTFITIPITLIYCSKIEVTVMAVGAKSKSDPVTKSHPTTPTQEDINAVIISYDSFNPTTRELRWSVDRLFIGCDIEYQLTINEHEPFKTKETIYQLPEGKMNPICQDNDVKIKVIVDGVGGEEQEIDQKIIVAPSVNEVQDVNIAFEDFNPVTKLLSWTIINNPFLECTVKYDVTINDLPPKSVESNSFDLQTVQLNPACQNNVVRVRPEIQSIPGREQQYDGKIVVDPTEEEVLAAIITFDDFNWETRVLSWNLNRPFTECTVTYNVTVNNLPFKSVETNNVNLQDVQLNPACENNLVRVKPEIQSILGRDQQLDGRIVVYPTVEEVQEAIVTFYNFNSETKILSWVLNKPFTQCIVTYNVTVNNLPPIRVETNNVSLQTLQLNSACENNMVMVQPEIHAISGRDQRLFGRIVVDPTVEEVQEAIVTFDNFNSETRILSWNLNRPFTECIVTYNITVNNLPPIRVENSIFNLHTVQLNPACENNEVMVRPEIHAIPGRDQRLDGRIVVNPTVEEVQEATVTFYDFNSETKILSWNLNRPFSECIVTFNVTINNLPPTRVENSSLNLHNVHLNPICENNVVMVQPEIQAVLGRDQQLVGRIVVYPTVEEVQETIVGLGNFNSETRILSWSLNRPFTECIVTYNVTVNNLPPIRVETNSINLQSVQLNPPCENNVVMIQPEIHAIPGRNQQLHTRIVVDPTVLEVHEAMVTFNNFNTETRILSWNLSRPFTECTVTFNVTVNNLPPIRVETNNINLSTVQLNPTCETNTVMVKPEIQAIQGWEQRLDGRIVVYPTVEEVQEAIVTFYNFNSETKMLSWNLNRPFTQCIVTYNVTVNNLPFKRVETNNVSLQTVQLNPSCENNQVMVKPEIHAIPGRDQRLDGSIFVYPTVLEVQEAIVTFSDFNSQTNILSWVLNRPFAECRVAYHITINNLLPRRIETNNVTLQAYQLHPACESNEVIVKPEIQSIPGRDQRLEGRIVVDPTVAEVQEAIVTFNNFNSETRILSWNLNRLFTKCIVTYDVTVNNLPPIRVETNNVTLQTVQLNPSCENNVVMVRPEIHAIPGRDQRLDGRIFVDPTIEEVQEALVIFNNFNSETRILSWNLSRPFTECIVTYDVTVNYLPPIRVITNNVNLQTVQLNPICENNVVSVKPEIHAIPGRDQQLDGTIAVEPSSIPNVRNSLAQLSETDRSIKVVWQPPLGLQECELTYNVHLWGDNGETPLHYSLGLVEREFIYAPIPISDNCDTIEVSIVAMFRDIIGTTFKHVTCIYQ